MYPESYRYTREHEWISIEGGVGTVGITHHAQEKLGDIVFVELPAVGRQLEATEALGSVESVKAVADIYSPLAGEVLEVNSALADHPETLNQDPHGAGWLVRLKLADPGAVDGLLSARDYEEFVRSEEAG
jgi:glycine cleavage system H protein